MIAESLKSLIRYIEDESFRGYDPYDTLNTKLNILKLGRWPAVVITQLQKRNPINIRPLLGIKKEYNAKAVGLLLKAYCLLLMKTSENRYSDTATNLFKWLSDNYSKGFSGYAWGYNFDWASPGSYLKAYTPSVVVTSFVADGIFEYYKITKDLLAKEMIISSARYVRNDIPVTTLQEGICFSYTHQSQGCCYNASLLAAEILARADYLNQSSDNSEMISRAVNFVLSRQKDDGKWGYSYVPYTGRERMQIDFHQGFILVSLANLNNLMVSPRQDVNEAIKRGLDYYRNNQFFGNGRSLWRVPKKWPVDIHNQSQGIITFARLKKYDPKYLGFARRIAEWTIKNMQSEKGCFYYRKTPLFTNKIPYMRWSQAWMMLALVELLPDDVERR